MTSYPTAFQAIIDDFQFLDQWEDKFQYIIELGNALKPAHDHLYDSANLVKGCASQVWLTKLTKKNAKDGLHFEVDSDSKLVKGLAAIILTLSDGESAANIIQRDYKLAFSELGLAQNLTAQRSNGLASMEKRIKEIALSESNKI